MQKRTILNRIFMVLLIATVVMLLACEGTPDRSLTIKTYAPFNQNNESSSPVMQNVTWVRVGVFEKVGDDYRNTALYEFTDLTEDLDLEDLPASETIPYTYVIEGFGANSVSATITCDSCPSTAWSCQTDPVQRLDFCTRTMEDAVVARGVSGPTLYTGDDSAEVDVMLSLVQDFAVATVPEGDPATMVAARHGHGAIATPDGKVLLIGGESTLASSTYPPNAEVFDPATSTFSEIQATGFNSGRAYFSMTPLPTAESDDGTVTTASFLMIGGQDAGGAKSEIYIGTYDVTGPSLTLSQVTAPAGWQPISHHSATVMNDGKVLIVGGQTTGNSPINNAWIFDPATRTVAATGALSRARYRHSATLMPNGNVVVVGGLVFEGNEYVTTSWVEVYKADTGIFERPDYGEEDGSDAEALTSRAGHVAVLVANRQADGSVAEVDYDSARVAIYGGYRYEDQDFNSGFYYYNMPPGQSTENVQPINVLFIDSDGKVEITPITPNPGYVAAMTQGASPMPHPAVDSQVLPLGDSGDTVLLVGGRANNNNEPSRWAEVVKFAGGEGGYSLSSFEFGPADEDVVNTPFRAAVLGTGRFDHTVTLMSNGMVLVAGGRTFRNNQTLSLSTAEIFVPPTYNRWGNVFKVVSDF